MKHFTSPLLSTLNQRGFIADCTDYETLDTLLQEAQKPVPVYIGFDCTAPSLHVGSLIQIMTLRHIQKSGHKPIVLMGGGTTKVGDPSGKDASRKMLDDQDIKNNMESIKQVFSTFMDFEESFDANSTNAFMVNNNDWLSGINYIEFLRDYGKLFSVNRMLSMESVKQRLSRESHLSFLEFNYMILQAFDFVKLYETYGCRVQIGGSDQWGNIVNGIELQRRVGHEDDVFGLTTPLITTASGAKMGKTEGGAVWLNADVKSPYDYWQFWRNTEDADVGRFMRLFTELSEDDIATYEAYEGADINQAKVILANAATTLLHGEDHAKQAEASAKAVFEQGGTGESLPTYEIAESELSNGVAAFKLFMESGLCSSGGDARRLIKGGGAKVNGKAVSSAEQPISLNDMENNAIKLSAGKKKHLLVKVA